MKFRRASSHHIESADRRYTVSKSRRYYKSDRRDAWQYDAWGPPGSQQVDYIAKQTAEQLRELGREVQPEVLYLEVGRAHLGTFDTSADAIRACEAHAEQPQQGALEL